MLGGKGVRPLFVFWAETVGGVALIAASASASTIRDWNGLNPSSSALSRANTGITNPILIDLPRWSRNNAVDLSFVSANPALLSQVYEKRPKNIPVAIQALGGGSKFSAADALRSRQRELSGLVQNLAGAKDEVQRSRVLLSSQNYKQGLGYSVGFMQERNALLDAQDELTYQRYRGLSLQISGAGAVFQREGWGQLDLGLTIKSILRVGDELEIQNASSAPSRSLRDAELNKAATAFGLDYGLLYTLPKDALGAWDLQIGLVWRDMGTTQFSLGQRTSTGRRFSYLPNNQIFGVGLGLPKFRDGIRSALRIEYREWMRNVSAWEKLAASAELRLPVWASFTAGTVGGHFSGGMLFRFPLFEAELATHAQRWGANWSRSFLMEIRSAF